MIYHQDYDPLIELAQSNHIVMACIRSYPDDPKTGMQAMVIALAKQTDSLKDMFTNHMMICTSERNPYNNGSSS